MSRRHHLNICPELPLDGWTETYDTLHMWSQVVGKIRLMQAPLVNHSWDVTLHLTLRGLTRTPIPHGTRTFEVSFDFIDHHLEILTSEGKSSVLSRVSRSVAAFYAEVTERMPSDRERLARRVSMGDDDGARTDP